MKRSVYRSIQCGLTLSAIALLCACSPEGAQSRSESTPQSVSQSTPATNRAVVNPEREKMLAVRHAQNNLQKNGLNNETLGLIGSGMIDGQSATLVARQRPALPTNEIPAVDLARIVPFIPAPKHASHGEWREWETSTTKKQLATLQQGVLVAPVQTLGYRFSHGFLSAISLGVADQLNQQGTVTYDPILVHRALGIGRRHIPIDELKTLARELNARALVVPFAGHNADHHMFVRVERHDLGQSADERPQQQSGQVTFTDHDNPFEVAMTLIDPMIKQINPGGTDTVAAQRKNPSGNPRHRLSRIATLVQAEEAANIDQAILYQWMATLAPDVELRNTLFARSLVITRSLTADSVTPILNARALTYLGATPAARRALSAASGAQAQAALAFTNGQLSAMVRALEKVPTGAVRDLLLADLATMQAAADDHSNGARQALSASNPDWRMVVHQALAPATSFRFLSNVELAPGLEKSNVDVTPQAVHDRLSTHIDVDVIERLRARQARTTCKRNQYCPALAFEDLMGSLAIRNAMRATRFFINTLDQPKQGAQYLEGLAPLLRSHPLYERTVFNKVLGEMQAAGKGRTFDRLKARLQQGQRWSAANSDYNEHHSYTDGPGRSIKSGPSDWWHFTSRRVFPPAYFARNRQWGDPPRDQADLQRELNFMSYAWAPADNKLAGAAKMSAQIDARYGDHPEWISQQVAHLESQRATPQNINHRIQMGKTLIRQRPDLWDGYRLLGFTQAIYGNKPAKAATTFWRYPGFTSVNQDNVLNVEGRAAHAARYFFWRGHFAQSKPFLEWITQLDTGSGEYLRAEQRLSAINGRFAQSAAYAQARVQRYGDAYGLRDLTAWLFASNDHEAAWGVFDEARAQAKYQQIWLAAHVGARIEGRTWQENLAWLRTANAPRPDAHQYVSFAAVSATGLALMDRMPEATAAADIRDLENSPIANRTVFSLGDFTQAMQLLYAGEWEPAATGLAQSVAQWRRGAFVGTQDAPINDNHSMVLPYATYARVKATGHAGDPVVPYKLWGQLTKFNHELANAFRSGLTNDTAAAIAHLSLAKNEMPYAGRRPIYPAYQWAQACAWLYRDTGKAIYKTMALDWAIKYQTIMPWQAWPYALEAKFTERAQRRVMAASMAYQLDPHSFWLSQLPNAVKTKAIARNVPLPWMAQFKALHQGDGRARSARK